MDFNISKKPRAWSKEEALERMCSYCASQERAHMDVRTKLIEHQVFGDVLEDIMATLISENFLNEERYALAYARGKANQLKWGPIKIQAGLRQKQVSDYSIKKALESIQPSSGLKKWNESTDPQKNLESLIGKWREHYEKKHTGFALKNAIVQAAMRKGYGYKEVDEILGRD
jgi:regulatory protein